MSIRVCHRCTIFGCIIVADDLSISLCLPLVVTRCSQCKRLIAGDYGTFRCGQSLYAHIFGRLVSGLIHLSANGVRSTGSVWITGWCTFTHWNRPVRCRTVDTCVVVFDILLQCGVYYGRMWYYLCSHNVRMFMLAELWILIACRKADYYPKMFTVHHQSTLISRSVSIFNFTFRITVHCMFSWKNRRQRSGCNMWSILSRCKFAIGSFDSRNKQEIYYII